jgi:uncharacterized membrane protein
MLERMKAEDLKPVEETIPPVPTAEKSGSRLPFLALIAGAVAIGFAPIFVRLSPVGPALLAWLLLSETIGFWQVLGGILVLFGILTARQGNN